ncbi:MAG: hypothetical protein NVS3B10_13820 [Polyangiales bacterium]
MSRARAALGAVLLVGLGLGGIVVGGAGSGCGSSSAPPATAPKQPPCAEKAGPFAPLSTRCGQLVDDAGRVVILRGVNARVAGVFDPDLGPGHVAQVPVPVVDASDLGRMRRIGFSVLRLPVNWSGIEPVDHDPPQYDEAYLARVDAAVAAAKSAHVRVLLDLHQDAYSKWIGEDGAPLWAIVPPPDHVTEGPLTSLSSRITSPQVQRAFSTFFSRTDPQGARLRARYAAMASALMKRHAGDPTVIGLDLFNEPVADDAGLRAFDEELGAAIRAVDPQRVLFVEPPGIRNLFDRASLAPGPLSLGGVVYAPHVYTHAFTPGDDSAWRASFGIDDLRPSNAAAREEADSWHAPLFVGEYGWGPTDGRFDDYIGMQQQLQDETMASSTFWLWKEDSTEGHWGLFDHDAATDRWTERDAVRRVFSRVNVEAIGGWPVSWRWDGVARRFTLTLIGDPAVTAPTLLHLPTPEDAPGGFALTCDGRAVPATADADGVVAVGCAGPGEHVVVAEARGGR